MEPKVSQSQATQGSESNLDTPAGRKYPLSHSWQFTPVVWS